MTFRIETVDSVEKRKPGLAKILKALHVSCYFF